MEPDISHHVTITRDCQFTQIHFKKEEASLFDFRATVQRKPSRVTTENKLNGTIWGTGWVSATVWTW